MSNFKPNVVLPLGASYNTRGNLGYTNTITSGLDQRKVNSLYEYVRNAVTEGATVYLVKRPGVTSGGLVGDSATGVVNHLITLAASPTSGSDVWVISKKTSTNEIRASNASTTTVILTDADLFPQFVDHVSISGTDTVVVQCAETGLAPQRVFYSTAIATWTEIVDADFTALYVRGKMEFMDGYAFAMTYQNRIHNSDLNSLSSWGASNYITKSIAYDNAVGLAKLKGQILAFGQETVEVFYNAGNAVGSPLGRLQQLEARIGLSGRIVNSTEGHYYAAVGNRMYFVGGLGQANALQQKSAAVYAYDGARFEKVSTVAIDKILNEVIVRSVSSVTIRGMTSAAFEIAAGHYLMFFPDLNEWFEWTSSLFSTRNAGEIFMGIGSDKRNHWYFRNVSEQYTDAGTNYDFVHQFGLPSNGNNRKFMPMCGVEGDTARSALSLSVAFSDDDWQTTQTARSIDMTSQDKKLTRCGSYKQRGVKLSYTGSLPVRLKTFIAQVRDE